MAITKIGQELLDKEAGVYRLMSRKAVEAQKRVKALSEVARLNKVRPPSGMAQAAMPMQKAPQKVWQID